MHSKLPSQLFQNRAKYCNRKKCMFKMYVQSRENQYLFSYTHWRTQSKTTSQTFYGCLIVFQYGIVWKIQVHTKMNNGYTEPFAKTIHIIFTMFRQIQFSFHKRTNGSKLHLFCILPSDGSLIWWCINSNSFNWRNWFCDFFSFSKLCCF